MSHGNAKQSLFEEKKNKKKNWVAREKESDYFFGLYTLCYLSVFILAYAAQPGDFTEIAYFQWYSKTKRKKKTICV